jgi:hypothetical protein
MKQELEKENIKCIDCESLSDGYCEKLGQLLENGFIMRIAQKLCGGGQKMKLKYKITLFIMGLTHAFTPEELEELKRGLI